MEPLHPLCIQDNQKQDATDYRVLNLLRAQLTVAQSGIEES